MTKIALWLTVKRIEKMEKYYNTLLRGINSSPLDIDRKALKSLTAYYENGKWLKDYETDEKGLLPSNLKRGVLSQDGVFNLLKDINQGENNQTE